MHIHGRLVPRRPARHHTTPHHTHTHTHTRPCMHPASSMPHACRATISRRATTPHHASRSTCPLHVTRFAARRPLGLVTLPIDRASHARTSCTTPTTTTAAAACQPLPLACCRPRRAPTRGRTAFGVECGASIRPAPVFAMPGPCTPPRRPPSHSLAAPLHPHPHPCPSSIHPLSLHSSSTHQPLLHPLPPLYTHAHRLASPPTPYFYSPALPRCNTTYTPPSPLATPAAVRF